MPDVTFRYNGAKITVRDAIGRDAFESPYILHDLIEAVCAERGIKREDLPDLEWGSISRFVDILQRSTVDGKLEFEWPQYPKVTADELHTAYKGLMYGPRKLAEQWRNALRDSNLETPDPED